MPPRIDRIGRAHEWLTSSFLNQSVGNQSGAKSDRTTAELRLAILDAKDRKRVEVGSSHTAPKLIDLAKPLNIVRSRVVGEESKKPGSADYDVELTTDTGTSIGFSLKLYKDPTGVNVRNPTIESIARYLTGSSFESELSPEDKRFYAEAGIAYSRRDSLAEGEKATPSLELGHWAAPILARLLQKSHRQDPIAFVQRLMTQMRVGTNLVITVVDEDGRFLGFVTKFGKVVNDVIKRPESLCFVARGISVMIAADSERLCKIDNYMMSGSAGLGKKLRCVIRVDFERDPN